MRVSKMLYRTLKEDPRDAETASHKLLLKAGFIHPLAAGLFTYLPMMHRVLRKVAQIVREEMDRAGAQEIVMPILQPQALWEESGRWERYITDGIMFQLKDRKETGFCLGPTHEEVVTDLVRTYTPSYKDLPLNLYQIADKFRDELRPRFGLMRCREFIMKDAYSFDMDEESMGRSFDAMYSAYCRIFERCGIEYRAVEADSGAIGGSGSVEFMVLAGSGEDTILECPNCKYGANTEKANSSLAPGISGGEPAPLEEHDTPNIRTVEQLEGFFSIPPNRMVKTVLFEADGEPVAVLMRGDLEINEVKLANAAGAMRIALAKDDFVKRWTRADVGFAGPVSLDPKVRVLADLSVEPMTNILCGCNKSHKHCLNVNIGRDFPAPEFKDLRLAKEGDTCARCGQASLRQHKGIEVGHIFKLGSKYSVPMNLTYLNQENKPQIIQMGCYGIGVSRVAASVVEQSHDANGIIWPEEVAPYQVVVIAAKAKDEVQEKLAERIYTDLLAKGVEVVYDDRANKQLGHKLADADLIGYPWKIIAGRRATEGVVELKSRKTGEATEISVAEAVARF